MTSALSQVAMMLLAAVLTGPWTFACLNEWRERRRMAITRLAFLFAPAGVLGALKTLALEGRIAFLLVSMAPGLLAGMAIGAVTGVIWYRDL